MHVIAGLEIRVLLALGGHLIGARWTFSLASFRHPGMACTAACLRARAAGVVAEVCQTFKTSASPLIRPKT